jgi:hypothetical protein
MEEPFKDALDVGNMSSEMILHWLIRSSIVPLEDLHVLAAKDILLFGIWCMRC